MSTETYQIGNLMLNAGTQEVTRDGEPVSLPPLSFSLLLTLARHAPNVVTTAQLEEEVWSGLVIDRGTINKRVVLVRNALREAGCKQDYITVVRGTGYRVAVPVQRLDDAVEAVDGNGHGSVVATPPLEATPSSSNLRWWVLALVVLVLGVVILGDRFGEDTPGDARSTAGQQVPQVDASGFTGAESLAVLPFEEPGAEGGDYFAEGLSREIIHLLDHHPALAVSSSSSSFSFRDSELTPQEIGERLGVDVLLGGSVARDGERVVVLARLIDAGDGRVVWSNRYDTVAGDIFGVQGEIVENVVDMLRVPTSGDQRERWQAGATADIEAYTLYLQGRALIDDRIQTGPAALYRALDSFRAAADQDPGFVRAHVGIATASFLLPSYDPEADREEWLQRAEASAMYALDLEPDSDDAMGVLAAIISVRGDPLRAAGLFERSLALGNQDSNVLHWHAMLATSMGYFESLLPTLREAYRLDPLNQLLGCSLAGSLNFSGQPESALVVLEGMERFSRRDLSTAVASLYLRDWERARVLLRGIELREGVLPARYADLLVEAFENPPRKQHVEQAYVDGVRDGELADLVAFEALLIMGSSRAFDLEAELEGSYFEYRLPEAVWHNWGVELRRDPRFKGWVRALGYDQHWRKYGWPDRCRPTGLNDFECV